MPYEEDHFEPIDDKTKKEHKSRNENMQMLVCLGFTFLIMVVSFSVLGVSP